MNNDLALPALPEALRDRAAELLDSTAAHEWCDTAPARLTEAAVRWQVTLANPVAGGRGGWLWFGHNQAGPVALKLPIADIDSHLQAQRELANTGVGAPVQAHDMKLGALLLTWADARPLQRTGTGSLHEQAVLATLRRFEQVRPATELPSLHSWLAKRLTVTPADVSSQWPVPSPDEHAAALERLAALPDDRRLCHGDLNPGNMLVDRNGHITFVDARGVSGDACYDLATFIAKTYRAADRRQLEQHARRAAGVCGFDDGLTVAWLQVLRTARA